MPWKRERLRTPVFLGFPVARLVRNYGTTAIRPGVGLPDHMVVLFLDFEGLSRLFCTVAVPVAASYVSLQQTCSHCHCGGDISVSVPVSARTGCGASWACTAEEPGLGQSIHAACSVAGQARARGVATGGRDGLHTRPWPVRLGRARLCLSQGWFLRASFNPCLSLASV